MVMPHWFLEGAIQAGDSAKSQALLEERDYPPGVLNPLLYWGLNPGI